MQAKPEITALTGIRFFAASFVLLYHIEIIYVHDMFPEFRNMLWLFFGGGYLGVDLFFILSGFILSYNYSDTFREIKSKDYFLFLCKRLARVYPVHLFTLLTLGLAVFTLYQGGVDYPDKEDYTLIGFISNLLLVQAWELPMPHNWNNVSWSISAEWFAYLLFPFLAIVFSRATSYRSIMALLVLSYVLLITALLIARYQFDFAPRDVGLIRLFFEFSMGVLLHKLFFASPEKNRTEPPAIKFWHWLIVPFLIISFCIDISLIWAVPLFSWLILASARNHLSFNHLLVKPSMVYGGQISYALYMVHGMIFVWITLYFSASEIASYGNAASIGFILAYTATSYLAAAFVYHYVESPSRNLILSRLAARKPKAEKTAELLQP